MNDVVVTAPARLHFGMLDPAGRGRRRFGGIGVGVQFPRVVIEAAATREGLVVEGAHADRVTAVATRCLAAFGIRGGSHIVVREAIPAHMGLGSGTKLGMAVSCALAELHGIPAQPAQLAAASGRGVRSSIGVWTFAAPGLVVEGGARDGELSPLITRLPIPAAWRCILALPHGAPGIAGLAEERAFAELRNDVKREALVSRLVLTALLPGLLAGDIDEFGTALTEIQREVGAMFSTPQGSTYHPSAAPVIKAMLELGVPGVGQSSWGPTVYGVVESAERAASVVAELRSDDVEFFVVDFDRHGAQIVHSLPLKQETTLSPSGRR